MALSLSSVVEIHARLEGVAVIFFVALVVFEVLAHVSKRRETLFERIALVCFGIAILGEVCAYPYSRRIDALSKEANVATEGKIAALNKEAADARQKTGESDERASKALERAAKADERASKNEKEAAALRKRAEDEAMARVKIEARVAWRRLTAQQKQNIGSSLGRRFSDQGVSFWYSAGDTEASSFAADIAEAAQAARTLRVYAPAAALTGAESGRLGGPIRRDRTGVTVQSTNDDRSRQLAAAIIGELNSCGFDATRQVDPPFDPEPNSASLGQRQSSAGWTPGRVQTIRREGIQKEIIPACHAAPSVTRQSQECQVCYCPN